MKKPLMLLLLMSSLTTAMHIEDEETHEVLADAPDTIKDTVKETHQDDDTPVAEQPQDILDQHDDDHSDDDHDGGILIKPDDDEAEGIIEVGINLGDDEEEGDTIEEIDQPDGSHVQRVTHSGPGFKSVRVTTNGPPPGMMMGGGGPGGLMSAIMKDVLSGGGPPGGGTIRISGGPMGMGGPGGMMIRQQIIGGDDDDDDDDGPGGIPPEILDIMRMTEMMHMGGGFGGLRIRKKEEQIDPKDRHDESMDDIMSRMNKLSEEIGEKHENNRENFTNSKSERITQFLMVGFVLIIVILIAFVATCALSKNKEKEEEEIEDSGPQKRAQVGKSD